MRLAHLLLVHDNPLQAERLVKRLMYSETDIYIHIDKKTNISEFHSLKAFQNVFFIVKRTNVVWGDYSVAKATLNGMCQILQAPQIYSHINVLSGRDYPLKSASEIQKFLFANFDKTFMKFFSVDQDWTEAIIRIKNYHLGMYNYPFKYRIQSLLNKILPPKTLPNNLNAYGASQWLTITPEHASYVINYIKENKSVERFFKMTWGADEVIFQTILLNSIWKDNIVNDYLRHIEFEKGASRPIVFTMKDAENVITSNKFYARKFDLNIDKEVLDYIDRVVNNAAQAQINSDF